MAKATPRRRRSSANAVGSAASIPRAGRQRLDVGERREKLLRLGKEIFSHTSYDAVSTDELAKRAGVSKGLLYHYFPSKRQFYVETIEVVAREILEQTAPAAGVPFDEVVRQSLTAFVSFVENNASLFRALIRGGIGSDPEVEAIVEQIRALTMQRVAEQWKIAKPSKRLLLLLYGWVGYVEAVCLRWVEELGAPAKGIGRDEVVEMLVLGLDPVRAEVSSSLGRRV